MKFKRETHISRKIIRFSLSASEVPLAFTQTKKNTKNAILSLLKKRRNANNSLKFIQSIKANQNATAGSQALLPKQNRCQDKPL